MEYNYFRGEFQHLQISSDLRNLEMSKIIRKSFYVVALAGLGTLSSLQWVGDSIHPVGYGQSRVMGTSTGIIVGLAGSPNAGAGY